MRGLTPSALDRAVLSRALECSGDAPLIVALSGGGDSTALLHLLVETLGAARLRAVIVDHALRAGSRNDAERAAGFASELGVVCGVITLAWPEGPSRAQAHARERRYEALCNVAHIHGARVVVTGHTRDDQAETVFMRAARGSGWRGLAGMRALSPLPLWPQGRGLWLARPLLSARRSALRALLSVRGASWIDDPANANSDFARVRVRQRLADLERAGLDPMRFARVAERLGSRTAAVDAAAAALAAGSAEICADRIQLTRAAWRGPVLVRQRALGALLAAVAGADREPNADQVAALETHMSQRDFRGATLGGVVVRVDAPGWTLMRDVGALLGRADGGAAPAPLALAQGAEMVWDGRLALTAPGPDWTVCAGAEAQAELKCAGAAASLDHAAPRWLLAERLAHALAQD